MKTERIKMKKHASKDIPLTDAWDEYEKSLKVRKLSEYSIITKRTVFIDFMKFCGDTIKTTGQVTNTLIDDYILWLQDKGNRDTTINSKSTNFKPFIHWCMDNGYCDDVKFKHIKEGKTIKKTYSEEQLRKILEKPDIDRCGFAEYRNWVLCNYFLATGNRLNSVINIKIKDVDFDNNLVTLTVTKNKVEQLLPVVPYMMAILQEYLTYRGGEPDDYLFVTVNGEQLKRISCQQALMYYIREQRGVEVTSIHAFRRTFATMYVDNGGNLFALQQLMGHSKLETTRKYVNLSIKQLQANYDAINPLSNIANKQQKKQKVKMR